MAYLLKYYKELVSHGHRWRLEIHQDTDDAIEAVEIGPVLQGLRLIMQGDQADIDTPIVKTSLEMVFVDAPDLEDERKCGYWEEFYTSSATEYRVRLMKDGAVEWTGYVTPDSFSESLQYRGSVTIIARDNLGALQDFEYDATSTTSGMISVSTLITKALNTISFPMGYTLVGAGIGARKVPFTPDSNTPEVYNVLFNNKSFKDKTWLEAVEAVLSATGLVLRYVGGNTFKMLSLRDIPLCGKEYWWDVPVLDTVFCAYGQRELSPAAKSIISEVSFEIDEDIAKTEMPASAYGDESTYTFYRLSSHSGTVSKPEDILPVHGIVAGNWEKRNPDDSLALNPFAYTLKEGFSTRKKGNIQDDSIIYVAANGGSNVADEVRNVGYKLQLGPGKYSIAMQLGNPVALYDELTKIGWLDVEVELSQLIYSISVLNKDGSIIKAYNATSDSWESASAEKKNTLYPSLTPFPTSVEVHDFELEELGYLLLKVYRISAPLTKVVAPQSRGMYIPLEVEIKDASLETTAIPESLRVTTKYNEKNNILIQSQPNYGFNPGDVAAPSIIKNGMFVTKNGWFESSEEWKFNSADAGNPLPVLIHQQLLAYYSKPNNVLTGELATDNPLFNALYAWSGKAHLLTSGALNVITGRMENVVLREFARYDHMWETWVETDDVEVDFDAVTVTLKVHSKKSLTSADIIGLPLWIIGSVSSAGSGVYKVSLAVEANSSVERSTIFSIDTALVRITQLAPGDYGLDYGEDYS